MRFEFATASRILFGPGVSRELPQLAAGLGRRAFVIIDRRVEPAGPLPDLLRQGGIETEVLAVSGEPTTETALAATVRARAANCDLVIGIGGGSVLDTGKAVAALLNNAGDVLDYLEVIGRGRPLTMPSAPCIAVPTTAGTGSEVTRNAVLMSREHRVKVSLRSPHMLPRIALVDPELTYSLPPEVTASTGMDALTQVIEPYVSNSPNPMTDALCLEGMKRAARSLRAVMADGRNAAAREDMSVTSLFGGLALANSKLGAVHGLAGPLGGLYPAPHGAICARLLPFVMRANLEALRARAPESPVLARYEEVARALTGKADAQAEDGVNWVSDLCRELPLKTLSEFGVTENDLATVAAQGQAASSMKGNAIPLSNEEVIGILREAL